MVTLDSVDMVTVPLIDDSPNSNRTSQFFDCIIIQHMARFQLSSGLHHKVSRQMGVFGTSSANISVPSVQEEDSRY